MSFNPLNPWGLFDEADARERERRRRIGVLGRLKEDTPSFAMACFIICAYAAMTAGPWLVGAYTIGTWLFGEFQR